jgi:hypothetical protein
MPNQNGIALDLSAAASAAIVRAKEASCAA